MPTPQHHLGGFVRDILPTAFDKATAVVVAAGTAGAVFEDEVTRWSPLAVRLLPIVTILWIALQAFLAIAKHRREERAAQEKQS